MLSVMRFGGSDCSKCIPLDEPLQKRQIALECVHSKSREQKLEDSMKRMEGPQTKWDDPELIKTIKYLIAYTYVTKFSLPLVQTPQAKEVDQLFKGKVGFS